MKRFLRYFLTLILLASLIAIPANVFALASKNPTGNAPIEDGITYTNGYMGFSITLPKDWKGQYRAHNYYADPSAPYVVFTHTASEDAGVNGGELTIKRYMADKTSKDDVIAKGPWRLALCTEDYTYFYMTPTGVEYTAATESGYRELADGVESIIQSMKAVPITLAAGPTYEAVGKTDENGLTDNYIYSFANGQKDAAPGDTILMLNGQLTDANSTLLFINGTLIADYEIIIRNGRALAPLGLISKEFGASADWDGIKREVRITKHRTEIDLTIDSDIAFVNGVETELDCPAILYKDSVYAPLRFVAENLGALVQYSSRLSPEHTYYHDTQMPVSPANTIIRDYANILIDEKHNFSGSVTMEEAMIKTRKICLEGLDNFFQKLRANLADSNENPDRFNGEYEIIKREINRMLYIGEVSRFYKFTIGPYDILFDRINAKIYFIIYSSGTIVKEVDINDAGLFMPVFIVG